MYKIFSNSSQCIICYTKDLVKGFSPPKTQTLRILHHLFSRCSFHLTKVTSAVFLADYSQTEVRVGLRLCASEPMTTTSKRTSNYSFTKTKKCKSRLTCFFCREIPKIISASITMNSERERRGHVP